MMHLSTVLLLAPICSKAFVPARRIKTTPRLAAVAPAAAVVKSAAGAGFACAAVGFVSAHAAVSYGYGLAIAWHARAALRSATTPVAVRVLLAYGLKVTAYQALRDREKHYRDAVLPLFRALEKDTKCPFTRTTHKIPLVAGVAVLLALYAAPIRFLANAPRPRVTVFAGAAAAVALAVQTVADAQKFLAKRRAPDRPCTTGLWRVSRHVNYAADVVLHGAVAAAAALSAPSAAAALLAVLAPLMMVNIVLSATESLDGRQRLAYRDDAFEAYVAATPRLFFT
ncbi:unnamed protein product [Pelagomonas calceolata]|uniref:Steroid 5-alpha reductase C-terminal domain-containing protein n=1 Tax=Pelagomonas calceolata TaxID=35677 RepID=A0A8J2S923_9STRA|nr:unnamed protein product [Pelagomonas calceolata]